MRFWFLYTTGKRKFLPLSLALTLNLTSKFLKHLSSNISLNNVPEKHLTGAANTKLQSWKIGCCFVEQKTGVQQAIFLSVTVCTETGNSAKDTAKPVEKKSALN